MEFSAVLKPNQHIRKRCSFIPLRIELIFLFCQLFNLGGPTETRELPPPPPLDLRQFCPQQVGTVRAASKDQWPRRDRLVFKGIWRKISARRKIVDVQTTPQSTSFSCSEWGRDWLCHIGLYRFQQKLRNHLQSADTWSPEIDGCRKVKQEAIHCERKESWAGRKLIVHGKGTITFHEQYWTREQR